MNDQITIGIAKDSFARSIKIAIWILYTLEKPQN